MLGERVKIVSDEKIRSQHMILEITPILRYVLIHPRIKHWREIDHDIKMELWGVWASVLHFPAYNSWWGAEINIITLSPKRDQEPDTGHAEVSTRTNRKVQGVCEETKLQVKSDAGESYQQLAEAKGVCWRQGVQKIPRELSGTGLLHLATLHLVSS